MEVGVNNDEGMDVSSGENKGLEVVENEDKDDDAEGGDEHKGNEPEDMAIRNNDKECLCRIFLLNDPTRFGCNANATDGSIMPAP